MAILHTPFSVGEFRPIYDPEAGETQPWCINDHCFAKGPDGLWHLFAITHIKPFNFAEDPGRNLAHATARTLTQQPWTKQPFALTVDPNHSEHLLWAPHIVEDRGLYHMFVCVGAREGHEYAIHHLTSKDLWHWDRPEFEQVLSDGFDARDPMVIRDHDRWILYYTANSAPNGGHHIVASMTSTDLVQWKDRRVVFEHPQEGTFGGPTESPFVVRRGRIYYLFITDNDTVHVYESRDPMRWKVESEVGNFHAHACELVRDEAGTWFVSNVGWMNGGLSLAEITWHDGQDHQSSSLMPAR